MINTILKASGADNGGSLDHANLVKSCLNTMTLLSQYSAELTRKRKSNVKYIVHSDFLALCGPNQAQQQLKLSQNVNGLLKGS